MLSLRHWRPSLSTFETRICRYYAYSIWYRMLYCIRYRIRHCIRYSIRYSICIQYRIRYMHTISYTISFTMVFPGTLPRDFARGACPGHFTKHIAYDKVYDIVYNIVNDIVYDIIYDMLCTCNAPSSIPLGGNEKLSCSTKIVLWSSLTDPEAVCALGWSGGNACGPQPQPFLRVQENHKTVFLTLSCLLRG